MAKIDFINQLKALGFNPQEPDSEKIYFEYVIPVGKNIGKKVLLGFEGTNSFPMNCPPGPHIMTLSDGWQEHPQNINPSQFQPGNWRYWSRPFNDWNRSERTAKAYLSHIKNIMMTV
ncbi:MAG TPA: hypothetical protein PLQ93_10690 [Bacteroidia bacterium]|nr:hypothetical protein [Bacteroidia bacterium]